MNDAKRKENAAKEKGESGECKVNELAKKTPLLDNLKKGAVVTAAVALLGGCALKLDGNGPVDDGRTSDSTTRLDGTERDTGEGVDEDVPELEDAPDMDVEEDVDEDEVDVVGDVEEEDVTGDEELDVAEDEVSDVVEEDAAMDVAEDEVSDVEEEEVTDVVEEDVADEEVTVICTPFDDSRTITIGSGSVMTVGGVDVKYKGLDTSGNALYDILCGGVAVRSDISIAVGSSRTVNVTEQGFDIALTVHNAYSWNTRVTVAVDAY